MSEPVRVYIERLKAHIGATTDDELAKSLGYSKQAIANWRRRGKVPIDAELKISQQFGAQLARTPELRNIATIKEDEIVYGAALLAMAEMGPDVEQLPSPQRELTKGRVFRELEGFLRQRLQARNVDYADPLSVINGILALVGDEAKSDIKAFLKVVSRTNSTP